MNYREYKSFELIYSDAIADVPKEWLVTPAGESTPFDDDVRIALECIYDMSKRESERDKHYCPDPKYLLEPFKWVLPHGADLRPGINPIKVIITAQDPYPRRADAAGLAFHSTNWRVPMSAKRIHSNLLKHHHIRSDTEPFSDYSSWAAQGVLLANRSFTTEEWKPGAHRALWGEVLDKALQMAPKDSVALLLGEDAKSLVSIIPSKEKIMHSHPASRDGDFSDKDVFGLVNEALKKLKLQPIVWDPESMR